ncbi:MAG: hypothetical protein ACERKV_06310 [Clostridiaceae bacterium]
MKELNLYDPNYTYKKHPIKTGTSKKGYPIIERMNNGLLFPETPKIDVDMETEKIKP